ncbi:MAG TPA: hypothetical protein GX511_04310 [Firmicutes bacterium]|nr:hypothetical protein [Bacillota bacterium]
MPKEQELKNPMEPSLMRGAPLLPAELDGPVEQKESGTGVDCEPVPPKESTPPSGAGENEGTTLITQGKAVVREVIVSGKAEAVLSTVGQAAEKTKEGIDVLLQILGLAKTKLEGAAPTGEGLPNPLLASQAEMVWNLIKVPEFQYLAATMLARMLAN